MPEIITIDSHSKKEGEREKGEIFSVLWRSYSSLDRFTKLFIVIVVIFGLVTPYIVNQYLSLRQRAADSLGVVNTVDDVVNDMTGYHEGCLEGQPTGFSWNKQPEADNPVPPSGYDAMTYWGVIYADCAGNPATNTRVQVANIKAYVLLKSTNSWQLIQSQGSLAGCYYTEDWSSNDCSFDIRNESVGQSIKPKSNMAAHFYAGDARPTYNNSDVIGLFVTADARLIVDNPNLPDDTSIAKLLMDVGGDWWQSPSAPYPNNAQVGLGKFKYLTTTWRAFNMILTKDSYVPPPPGEASHTINPTPIIDNPPPNLSSTFVTATPTPTPTPMASSPTPTTNQQQTFSVPPGSLLASDHAYLSDLPWTQVANGSGNVKKDTSSGGSTITINGYKYPKGLGVDAPSTVTLTLNSQCSSLNANMGIDDETGGLGSVIFQIYGDNKLIWQSGVINGKKNAANAGVNLTGVNQLKLQVIDGGNGNTTYDHADWASPILQCKPSYISSYRPTNNLTDTDHDGFPDAIENYIGTDPTNSCGVNAWPPDIDNDGIVNIIDIARISRLYDTHIGDGRYNKRYDLNADGVIDRTDLDIVGSYFLKKCK